MTEKQASGKGLWRSVYRALFGDMPPDRINWFAGRFAAPEEERAYKSHIVNVSAAKERLITFIGVVVYFLFGLLDLATFSGEALGHVLLMRWGVCGPIALALIAMTFHEKAKACIPLVTVAVMAIGSGSIIAMIAMMPPAGEPPYIVGILAIFIFFACMQRMPFLAAAATQALTVAAYSLVVVIISPKSHNEVVSGHFFMVFISSVAIVTTYIQELRSRHEYLLTRQREKDAGYIRELLIEATAADRAKINFLSIMSHELRTPLHQIVGFTEVVQNEAKEKAVLDNANFLDDINTSARGLLVSIGKMLRYADATAGKISYAPERYSARELIESVVDQARTQADQASIRIDDRDVEAVMLHIDHPYTSYALSQLVDNALKASPEGGVVAIRGALREDGGYVISVEDQGPGMTAAQIAQVFTPFNQGEEAHSRRFEGMGLGLTLSKKILADQSADLTLKTEPGSGLIAQISFPPELVKVRQPERPQDASA